MVALYRKAPNVKWKKKKKKVTCAQYEYVTNSSRIIFFFVWRFWWKVVKQNGTELINKGKGKEERNKIHCKGKESGWWISFKGYCEWIKLKSKHKILKEKDINNDKKILTSKCKFRGTFSEDLFPNFSLDNSWVSTVKADRIRSLLAKLEKSILRIESNYSDYISWMM